MGSAVLHPPTGRGLASRTRAARDARADPPPFGARVRAPVGWRISNAPGIGEYNFAGQYQQMPAPLGGGMVKPVWFRHYAPSELPPTFDRVVQSWDTANKASELSDYSVCTSWGISGKNLYLLDVLRRRMEYPELKRAVREQYERFRPSVVLIEDKASGTQLIQELVHEGLYAVTRYQPRQDKVMRMHAQTAMIENGFVRLPETAPWLAQYLHEMTVFPNGRHDDQVDSTAQLLDWFKRGDVPSSNAGIFEYYRQEAEKIRRQQAQSDRRVRLRVPRGISHVQPLGGPIRSVAADGTVELTEAEAAPLLQSGWERVDAGDPAGAAGGDPQTARPEPLSVMAKRLGILRPL
jgi:predicted phage terminase large subunit-like protein